MTLDEKISTYLAELRTEMRRCGAPLVVLDQLTSVERMLIAQADAARKKGLL